MAAKKESAKKISKKKASTREMPAMNTADNTPEEDSHIVSEKTAPGPIEITIEKRLPGEVPEKYHFYLNDGRRLKDIYELIEAFDSMSDEVFRYHVNEDKNDFYNWIKEVMNDDHLAKEIHAVEDRVEAQLKLLKHIVKKIRE
ncbi:hypothetical protein H6503_04535 [Candidatus Woesearchaeota archaeon]|nr:hypothetical protein [Candidatus Woesearchaeota archaeon]